MDRYEIRVAGHIDQRRADALGCDELRLLPDGGSQLVFVAVDQAALYGLITRLRDAGIELVAVRRVDMSTEMGVSANTQNTSLKETPNVPR
ncbi:MAG TPA: hypothetical protein VIK13_06495 [Candidatus Limnocylindrales bacterium]|jgi:hypothetical protein